MPKWGMSNKIDIYLFIFIIFRVINSNQYSINWFMSEIKDEKEENGNEMAKLTISEATPVRIGLIITLLGLFGSSIWWASSINSKLDSILAAQTSTSTVITELKSKDVDMDKEIYDLKLKQALVEAELKSLKGKVSN